MRRVAVVSVGLIGLAVSACGSSQSSGSANSSQTPSPANNSAPPGAPQEGKYYGLLSVPQVKVEPLQLTVGPGGKEITSLSVKVMFVCDIHRPNYGPVRYLDHRSIPISSEPPYSFKFEEPTDANHKLTVTGQFTSGGYVSGTMNGVQVQGIHTCSTGTARWNAQKGPGR